MNSIISTPVADHQGSSRILFFDTETTGLPDRDRRIRSDPSSWPRLVEVGWILSDDQGEEISGESYLILPEGFEIPRRATEIHGISTADARAEGTRMREVLEAFCRAATEADLLVAHNLSFDMRIILAELIRADMRDLFPVRPGICTMRSSTRFCALPGRFGKGFRAPSLAHLHYLLYASTPEKSHRALADARACAACYFGLIRKQVEMLPDSGAQRFFTEKKNGTTIRAPRRGKVHMPRDCRGSPPGQSENGLKDI